MIVKKIENLIIILVYNNNHTIYIYTNDVHTNEATTYKAPAYKALETNVHINETNKAITIEVYTNEMYIQF